MGQLKTLIWAINESRELMETMCAGSLQTAGIFGHNPELFGVGHKHTTHKARIWLLHKYLQSIDPQTIVVCMDGSDTLFNDTPEVLVRKFLQKKTRILVSAERDFCYQYGQFRGKFDALGGNYRYVNAGTFMGYAGNLFLMLEEMIELDQRFPKANDQGLLGIWVHQHLEAPEIVQLDRHCDVFWVTTHDWPALKAVAETQPLIVHPTTHSKPVIIHSVGNNYPPHRAAYDAAFQHLVNLDPATAGSPRIPIRFPSGESKEYAGTLASIAEQIAASEQLLASQLLFVQQGNVLELNEPVAEREEPVDLLIVIRDQYVICGSALETVAFALGYAPFVPPEAVDLVRDVENILVKPRFIQTFQDFFYKREELKVETRREIAPFLDAFRKHSASRLEELRGIAATFAEGAIVITPFNEPFIVLFENLLASCDRNGIDIRQLCLFFPMDEASAEACRQNKVRYFFHRGGYGPMPSTYHSFGHGGYRDCMFMKNAVVQDMLTLGRDVLFMDIDLVWLNDPLPVLARMARLGRYDFLFMYDGQAGRDRPLNYNTGFIYIRNTSFSRKAWQVVFDNFEVVWVYRSQQAMVNQVILHYKMGGLRARALDEVRFINGHMFVPRFARFDVVPDDAYVVHASWTRDIKQKLELLKEHGLWYLPDR